MCSPWHLPINLYRKKGAAIVLGVIVSGNNIMSADQYTPIAVSNHGKIIKEIHSTVDMVMTIIRYSEHCQFLYDWLGHDTSPISLRAREFDWVSAPNPPEYSIRNLTYSRWKAARTYEATSSFKTEMWAVRLGAWARYLQDWHATRAHLQRQRKVEIKSEVDI